MKIITHAILLASCILSLQANSQTLKTYSGAYPHANGAIQGDVKYSYTEAEDGQRIKQGTFSFSTPPDVKKTISVQGTYKDGSKEGKWTTTISRPKSMFKIRSATNNIDAITAGGLSVMSGNYANNLRTGEWNFIGGKAADKTTRTSIKSSANFVEGLLNGQFLYSFEDPEAGLNVYSFSVNGAFVGGFIDGKWTVKEVGASKVENIMTMEFDKGKLLSAKSINSATGQATLLFNDTYDHYIFTANSEVGTKYILSTYFRTISPQLSQVFMMWMGDPTFERFDDFLFADTDRYSGFAFYTK